MKMYEFIEDVVRRNPDTFAGVYRDDGSTTFITINRPDRYDDFLFPKTIPLFIDISDLNMMKGLIKNGDPAFMATISTYIGPRPVKATVTSETEVENFLVAMADKSNVAAEITSFVVDFVTNKKTDGRVEFQFARSHGETWWVQALFLDERYDIKKRFFISNKSTARSMRKNFTRLRAEASNWVS